MDKIITVSLEQMETFVAGIIEKIKPHTIIGLVGDLGAGKTTFTQILAKKLGINERVNSPTFNLLKQYKISPAVNGLEELIHVDAYRLGSVKELADIGFFEFVNNGKSLAVVEWADQLPELENNSNYFVIEFVGINNQQLREIRVPNFLLE